MGGFGSGPRYAGKPVIEDGLSIDLNKLIRDQLVIPGSHVQHSLVWRSVNSGEQIGSIGYEANLLFPENAWMRLYYSHNGEPVDYRIHLTTTRPNYGGVRWWFICPVAGKRASVLHSVPGSSKFVSFYASNAAYRSQRERKPDRMLSRAHALRRKLSKDDWRNDWPDKPKGMRWKTFHRLLDEIRTLEDESLMMVCERMGILDELGVTP